MTKRFLKAGLIMALGSLAALAALLAYAGPYGLHVLLRRGGTWWLPLSMNSSRISPSMRLALTNAPAAVADKLEWRTIGQGFDTAELPVLAEGRKVDRIMLARVDPAWFRFVVRNSPTGDKDLDQWMMQTGAALVVNGSYYARNGEPDTPLLAEGKQLGPKNYHARAGAFVSSSFFVGIRDLGGMDWKSVFQGAENAMVSYPLLVAEGKSRVGRPSRWLANRSFIGQDEAGHIIIGTTTDAFFTLERLAQFLLDAPIGLTIALNLDGGPVACQGISLNGYNRRCYGRWEARVEGDRLWLLSWPYGTFAMPVILAVFPK